MSRIGNLLAQILSAVYGKDVRQSIHDAIKECYDDVTNAKTIADQSASNADQAAADAENRTTAAISTMETRINTAIANCNSATTNANTAATNANAKANAAGQAIIDLQKAFDDLGLVYIDGKLCARVKRSE